MKGRRKKWIELLSSLEIVVNSIEKYRRFIFYITSSEILNKVRLHCTIPTNIKVLNIYPPNPIITTKEYFIWKVKMYPRIFEKDKILYSFGIRIDCTGRVEKEIIDKSAILIEREKNLIKLEIEVISKRLREYKLIIGPIPEELDKVLDFHEMFSRLPIIVLETIDGIINAKLTISVEGLRMLPVTIISDKAPSDLIPFKVKLENNLSRYNVKRINRLIVRMPDIPLEYKFI